MASAFLPDRYVQVDVKSSTDEWTICNMYTGVLCVEIALRTSEYKELIRKGFFIRDGKEKDSAGILNTTEVYVLDGKS